MNAYELMIKTNHNLIKGNTFTKTQKVNITKQLLAAKSSSEQLQKFYEEMRFFNNCDAIGRRMYPEFFIPPYNNGKKLKTVLNQIPKTHIFSANMYELEILRLLFLFAPNDPEIKIMIDKTIERLKTTTFGNESDGKGECFDTSLVVLRFLGTAVTYDNEWIQSRINLFKQHYNDKKRPWYCLWYYWLCLSELPFEIAIDEIENYKSEMLKWLKYKSFVMNSEHDKLIHPVISCMLRNILAKYPEYAYIKGRQPYKNKKDGRLYFDMTI